jgi:hypothetical protein
VPLFEQLVAVVLFTGINHAARLPVDSIGVIQGGMPPLALPRLPASLELWGAYLQGAVLIAFTGFLVTMSMARVFAARHSYDLDSNQELIALGASNLVGGMFSAFPVCGSFSRSAVASALGGRSPLHGVVQALVIALVRARDPPCSHALPARRLPRRAHNFPLRLARSHPLVAPPALRARAVHAGAAGADSVVPEPPLWRAGGHHLRGAAVARRLLGGAHAVALKPRGLCALDDCVCRHRHPRCAGQSARGAGERGSGCDRYAGPRAGLEGRAGRARGARDSVPAQSRRISRRLTPASLPPPHTPHRSA